jgi:prepilin-type N-terminal cleavage/methylation domain-containing protein
MRTRHAFSLVEVLIAIVVLALGLLGLAAVFPAVLMQQRKATDTVLGASVQSAIEQTLTQNAVFNKSSNLFPLPDRDSNTLGILPNHQRGWQLLSAIPDLSGGATPWSPPVSPFAMIWDGPWCTVNSTLTSVGLNLDPASGNMSVVGSDAGATTDPLRNHDEPSFLIPLTQRLSPSVRTAGAQPLYVWDFVARRIGSGLVPDISAGGYPQPGLEDDSVQLAVFVRRIDPGIRTPVGRSLSDVLTGMNLPQPTTDRRIPVAEDATTGRPTLDGVGTYSTIKTIGYGLLVPAAPNATPSYDQLAIDPGNTLPTLKLYAQQIGQKFVDDWGVVHTVTDLIRDTTTGAVLGVQISPPVDSTQLDSWSRSVSNFTPQIRFTTQVPVAVFVVTIPVPAPGSN